MDWKEIKKVLLIVMVVPSRLFCRLQRVQSIALLAEIDAALLIVLLWFSLFPVTECK